jgi:hypothetical protein
VTRRPAGLLNNFLHAVPKPTGEAKRRDDAADLVLRIVSFVVVRAGVVPIGHDRVADNDEIGLHTNVHVAVDVFNQFAAVDGFILCHALHCSDYRVIYVLE